MFPFMRGRVAMCSAGGFLAFDQACRRPCESPQQSIIKLHSRLHGMCQDDGPGASTVLGASWMMHQVQSALLHSATSFGFFTLFSRQYGTSWPARCSQDVIFDMPQQMVGSRVAVSQAVPDSSSLSYLCSLLCQRARLKCKCKCVCVCLVCVCV